MQQVVEQVVVLLSVVEQKQQYCMASPTSSMEWVVSTIARPGLASSMMSHTKRRLMGSIPVVGSSR